MAKKKMIHDFVRMKKEGEKITFLTAYDYPTAQFAEAALAIVRFRNIAGFYEFGI